MGAPTSVNLSAQRRALLSKRLAAEGLQGPTSVGIRRRENPAVPVPLTSAQRQMWLADQLSEGTNPFVITGGLRVRGAFDPQAFEMACEHVVRRHESLRTVFSLVDGEPVQIVKPDLPPSLRRMSVPGLPVMERERTASERLAALAAEPFNLQSGSLLRIEILTFAHDERAILLALHHVVGDLWSVSVLMREILTAYDSLRQGHVCTLPDLTLQFPDLAAHLSVPDPHREADLAWWEQNLAGVPSELPLITDAPRPARPSHRAGSNTLSLDASLVDGVRKLARARHMTPFMVYGAAFHALLARVSGECDVCVGTPVMGRGNSELEQLIGCLMNSVALRCRVDRDATFTDHLATFRRVCFDAFAHQDVPIEDVITRVAPAQHSGAPALFRAMITYQNVPLPRWESHEVRIEPVVSAETLIKYDLQLDLREDQGQVTGQLLHARDLFNDASARRLAYHYIRILRAFVADPSLRLSDVPLCDVHEREEVLGLATGERLELVGEATLSEDIARVAVEHPSWVAIVEKDRQTTYGELDSRATKTARQLVTAGVRPGDVVALSLPLSAELLVSMLATWKAGAAYLFMDPSWPSVRVNMLLEDCRAAMVVSDEQARPDVGGDCQWITLSTLADAANTGTELPGAAPDGVGYVLYTSGSTGKPKGVEVTHANIKTYVSSVPSTLGMGSPQARYLVLQPPVTDFVGTILFSSLGTGGELHLVDKDTAVDADAVSELIRLREIDYVKIVPTHLGALMRVVGADALMPRRSLVLGGEAAPRSQVAELLAAAGDTAVHNHYGPTETTIGVVTCDLRDYRDGAFLPLGRPVPGSRCYVVRQGELAPPGVAGELWVAGGQVSVGYVNEPELTLSRFLDDPFVSDASRVYRTGDKVCWTESGELRFLGREDGQVKIHGYRVELVEVEAALLSHPAVTNAVVVAGSDGAGVTQLDAYIVTSAGTVDGDEVRRWVGQRLPRHCVPSTVTVLGALPMTANGKVDRRALPSPSSPDTMAGLGRPPAPGLETTIAAAFTDVLDRPVVNATDSFFELGGDSLRAIQVVSAARKSGITLTTRDIFVHESVSAIAASVGSRAAAVTSVHDDGAGDCAPSPMLRRLRRRGGEISGYSHRVLVTLPQGTTATQVAAALDGLVNHHRILAATLDPQTWTLHVPEGKILPPPVEVASTSVADLSEDLLHAVTASVERLDPWRGHNLETRLFERDGALPMLLLVIHHVVVDGMSWQVILEDLRTSLEQVATGQPISLPPVPTSARSWSETVSEDAGSPQRKAEIEDWQTLTRGATPLRAPSVFATGTSVGESTLLLDVETSRRLLEEICPGLGASAHEVLLSAVALAARDNLGIQSTGPLLVEVESHGRHLGHVDASRTVGWLTSVYPVSVDLGASPATDDEMRTLLRRAVISQRRYPHDGLGYGALRYLAEGSPLGDLPEAYLVFNYLGQQTAGLEDLAWQPVTRLQRELMGEGTAARSLLLTRPLQVNVVSLQTDAGSRLQVQVMWDHSSWTTPEVEAFEHELVRCLETIARAGVDVAQEPLPSRQVATIRPSVRSDRMPVTHQQLNKITEPVGADAVHHNVVATVVLEPEGASADRELDVDALQRALDNVREKHEVFRTCLIHEGDEWFQRVEPASPWPLEVHDLRGGTEELVEAAVEEVVARLESTPMPVAKGSPMYTVLLRTGDRRWVLSQAFHHASVDPWGFAQYVEDLADYYVAERDGTPARRDFASLQLADLAAWQQRENELGPGRVHADYWRSLFSDLPPAPTLRPLGREPRPAVATITGFSLCPEENEQLKAAAAAASVSTFVYLLTVFQVLQAVATATDDVLVTVPLAGRDEPETHTMVGYLVNEVSIRTRIAERATFGDVMAQVRLSLLDAREHQQAPLRQLAATSDGRWDPMRTMFNVVDFGSVRLNLGGWVGTPWRPVGAAEQLIPEMHGSISPANLDLYLVLHERDGELRGLWMHAPNRFNEHAFADMVAAWPVLLHAVLARPDLPLSEVPTLLADRLPRPSDPDPRQNRGEA
ncbi:hypothetical protein GCM10027030_12700 [Luteococcus sediminum]